MNGTSGTSIIACEGCGQQNRIPVVVPPGKKLVCGSCRADLFDAPLFNEVECDRCGANYFDTDDAAVAFHEAGNCDR